MSLLLSWGTGHIAGTLSQHGMWQAKPQTSQTTPCLVKPTINDVQWLHFVGAENVRTKNWWDFGFGCKIAWLCDADDLFNSSWDNGDVGSWKINNSFYLTGKNRFFFIQDRKIGNKLTMLSSDKLLLLLAILGARLSSMSPSTLSTLPWRVLPAVSFKNRSRYDICDVGRSKTEITKFKLTICM